MDYIAQPKDYWIATNAINITRNALGKPNRIQCSVASGAAILCYIEGVTGLGYDNGHRFRTWPLTISPTYFNSNAEKYVYVAIPRSVSVGTRAVVVFPSEQLDVYGVNADDEQVGSTDYYYIWLQGILTETDGTSNREWQQAIDFGKKGTDEDLYDDTSSEWYQYSKVSGLVTFLKNIAMKAGTTFQNLILGNKELTGVATSNTAYTDSDALVATPGYVESQYLSKTHESTAQEQVGFLKGLWVKAKNLFGIDAAGNATLNSVKSDDIHSDGHNDDNIGGEGYHVYKDANGQGHVCTDFLDVRLKARFTELEIRRLSYVNADQVQSMAASKVEKVLPIGADGNVLTGSYSSSDIIAYRCLAVADDGSTATKNGWKLGDQARCQTFNITAPGNYTDVTNRLYWRLVVRIGQCSADGVILDTESSSSSDSSDDGDSKVYHFFDLANIADIAANDGAEFKEFFADPLTTGDAYHGYATQWTETTGSSNPVIVNSGNDAPAADDAVVQMGSQTDETRMGFFITKADGLNTGPYIYAGVNNFSLAGKMITKISPAEVLISARKLRVFVDPTAGSYEPLVIYRGDWTQGSTSYYYDEWDYQGSRWLCLYQGAEGITCAPGTVPQGDTTHSWTYYWKKISLKGDSVKIAGYAEYYYGDSSRPKPASPSVNGDVALLDYPDNSSYMIDVGVIDDMETLSGYWDHQNVPYGTCYIYRPNKHLYEATESGWRDLGKFNGDDGNGIVSVTRTYARSTQSTSANDTTPPTGIDTTIGSGGWASSSPAVNETYPYLWAKEIVVYTDTTKNTTKYYCIGARGANGVDAQDVEWAYIRTKTNVPPVIDDDSNYTDSHTPTGYDYTKDDHLPKVVPGTGGSASDIESNNSGNNNKPYECTDDPQGVDETWKYEWEIKRTKGDADANGHRTWNAYSGEMTLHNNFAESAFIIDIDNDNDQFGTDSDSKVLVEQKRSTKVSLYDGATPQTLTSLSAVLKYEDNSDVPVAVATKTTTAATGKIEVTVLANNTANAHTEIIAYITAVCAKGTKEATFRLRKIMGGAPGLNPIIYQLNPTNKDFVFNRDASNNLIPNSRSSQINISRTEGSTTTIISSAQAGITYDWGFDEITTAEETGKAVGSSISISNSQAASHYQVWVQLSTGDRETLPIVKDGAGAVEYKLQPSVDVISFGDSSSAQSMYMGVSKTVGGNKSEIAMNYLGSLYVLYSATNLPASEDIYPRVKQGGQQETPSATAKSHLVANWGHEIRNSQGSVVDDGITFSGNTATIQPGVSFNQIYVALFEVVTSGNDTTYILHDRKTIPIVRDGAPGNNGETIKTVTVYKRSDTQPDTPTGSTIPPAGWGVSAPAMSSNGSFSDVTSGNYAGWRKATGGNNDNAFIKDTITFVTTSPNEVVRIAIKASSEKNYDFIFVGNLGTDYAARPADMGNISDSRKASGEESKIVSITVPTAGEHTLCVIYTKDGSDDDGSDCGWYKVLNTQIWSSMATFKDDVLQGSWSTPVKWNGQDGNDGNDGNDGEDAWTVQANPSPLIIQQSTDGSFPMSENNPLYIDFTAKHGNAAATVTGISNVSNNNMGLAVTSATVNSVKKLKITGYNKVSGAYVVTGRITCTVSLSHGGKTATMNVAISVGVNLLGEFKREVIGDVETSVATKLTNAVNGEGEITVFNQVGTYIRSASEKTDRLTETVGSTNYGNNLFGFSKGIMFNGIGADAIPFVQGYGFAVVNTYNGHTVGRARNLGFGGKTGYYVVTCEIKMPSLGNGVTAVVHINLCDVDPESGTIDNNKRFIATNQWKKFTGVFNIPSSNPYVSGNSLNGFFDVENKDSTNPTAQIFVRYLQIEHGSVPSAFGICTEDAQSLLQEPITSEFVTASDGAIFYNDPNNDLNGLKHFRNRETYEAVPAYWQAIGNTRYINIVEGNGGSVYNVESGSVYTLSFWAKGSINGMSIHSFLYAGSGQTPIIDYYEGVDADTDDNTGRINVDGDTYTFLTTSWKKYYIHWYIDKATGPRTLIVARLEGDTTAAQYTRQWNNLNGVAFICGIRFDKGYVTSANRTEYQTVMRQTARAIDFAVMVNSMEKAGIHLRTESNGTPENEAELAKGVIDLVAGKVKFKNSAGTVDDKVWIDTTYGTLHAVNGDFSGTMTAAGGAMYFGKDGSWTGMATVDSVVGGFADLVTVGMRNDGDGEEKTGRIVLQTAKKKDGVLRLSSMLKIENNEGTPGQSASGGNDGYKLTFTNILEASGKEDKIILDGGDGSGTFAGGVSAGTVEANYILAKAGYKIQTADILTVSSQPSGSISASYQMIIVNTDSDITLTLSSDGASAGQLMIIKKTTNNGWVTVQKSGGTQIGKFNSGSLVCVYNNGWK